MKPDSGGMPTMAMAGRKNRPASSVPLAAKRRAGHGWSAVWPPLRREQVGEQEQRGAASVLCTM